MSGAQVGDGSILLSAEQEARKRKRSALSPKRCARWTCKEDVILQRTFAEYGSDWEAIAEFFELRTPASCKARVWTLRRRERRLKDQPERAARGKELSDSGQATAWLPIGHSNARRLPGSRVPRPPDCSAPAELAHVARAPGEISLSSSSFGFGHWTRTSRPILGTARVQNPLPPLQRIQMPHFYPWMCVAHAWMVPTAIPATPPGVLHQPPATPRVGEAHCYRSEFREAAPETDAAYQSLLLAADGARKRMRQE